MATKYCHHKSRCHVGIWLSLILLVNCAKYSIGNFPEPTRIEDKGSDSHLEKNQARLEPGPDYRLPGSIIPLHYHLRIQPLIYDTQPGVSPPAPGRVNITVQCVTSTDTIVMHQKFLEIHENTIEVRNLKDNGKLEVTKVEYDELRDFLTVTTSPGMISNEIYGIFMDFTAIVRETDVVRGLYYERYWDPKTEQFRVMVATQLEPLRARQVFPCFDEPTYKAPFDVVIWRKGDYVALGNSKLLKSEEDPENAGYYWDTFDTTVKMPTYLFAMGIGQYGFNEAMDNLYRLPTRVYGPLHLVEEGKGQLAADASAQLMSHFETKYKIDYNMPKVDSLSVPFKRGAMENYGLITYGESRLMFEPDFTTVLEFRGILHLLGHELGHQWFGNIVTCKWWSDIWLNEGFATYISYEGFHALWPQFDMMNVMIDLTVNNALRYDAGPSSHPIHQEAYDAAQIGVNMDTIGYDKGASVIRMMVSFLGEDVFYNGITQYLTKLYDSVAEQDDLFAELDATAQAAQLDLPESVTDVMHSWTLQKGFPLVDVRLAGENEVELSQELWENADVRNETVRPTASWTVPIKWHYQSQDGSVKPGNMAWLLQNQGSEMVKLESGTAWVLVNSDAGGYFRTRYDPELTSRLLQQLESNHTYLPTPGRVRLIDDQFTLGFEKYTTIESGLESTKYLFNEKDATVWSIVLGNLQKLRDFYVPSVIEESFRALKNYLLPRIDAALGIGSGNLNAGQLLNPALSNPEDSILISKLVDWNCALRSDACAYAAREALALWIEDPNFIPIIPDRRNTFFCKIVEVAKANPNGFDFILEHYVKNSTAVQLKRLMAPALACTLDHLNQQRLIQLTLEYNTIEKVDAVPILQTLLRHTGQGRLHLLNLLETSSEAIIRDYGWEASALVEVLSVSSLHLFSDDEVAKLEAIRDKNADIYKGTLDSTIAAVKRNNQWMLDFNENITKWFVSNK